MIVSVATTVAAVVGPGASLVYGMMWSAAGGFAAGMITSGGDLQAGLIGAASAVAFFGVGRIGGIGNPAFGDLGHLGKIALHGAIGGLSSVAQGVSSSMER